ncbi:MAG: copper homeostasis protein CutC [Verrucomicrobiales bacterium]|nr:copper homeostasis protein CutC [Verrucomicrobiales bacterium]
MIIEICVDCLESVAACAEAGADRIELCAGLVEGGTTPSVGFMKAARRLFPGRIMTMIRPRAGDFLYSRDEAEIMLDDIRQARDQGADGVVFGCLTADGDIDTALAAELASAASGMDITFHRAFDVSRDLAQSLETLVRLGIPRVLTSGGRPAATTGIVRLAEMVRQAGDRIAILPGGGVRAENIARVVSGTGVQEIHLSARETIPSPMRHRRIDIPMGADAIPGEYQRRVASAALIRTAKNAAQAGADARNGAGHSA